MLNQCIPDHENFDEPLAVFPAQASRVMPELDILFAAKIAHEANRGYCVSRGDLSQPPWHDLPDTLKQSVISGVRHIVEHPTTTPEQSHEAWLEYKRREGWIWGPVKDAVKKEHPCFLAYNELPGAQRSKDYIFGSVVRAVLGI